MITAGTSDGELYSNGRHRTTACVRINLFGLMRVTTGDGHPIDIIGRKTKALLAILALAQRPVLRSTLASLLWSRREPEQARASLRQEVHRFADAFQGSGATILRVTRDHIGLDFAEISVDALDVLLASIAEPDAIALMNTTLLADFDGVDPELDRWLAGQRERLREHAYHVANGVLALQTQPEAIKLAALQVLQFVDIDESAWHALIKAYADRDERGLAIHSFERYRGIVAAKLGVAPSDPMQALITTIRSETPSSLAPLPEPLAKPTPTRTARQGVVIGVLPFTAIAVDSDKQYLTLSLAEDLAACLSRFQWLSSVSSSSLLHFGQNEALAAQSAALDYLLTGTLHRRGDGYLITVRLIHVRDNGRLIHAKQYATDEQDPLALQDSVVAEMAAQFGAQIERAESDWILDRPLDTCNAYELVKRASLIAERLQREEFDVGEDLLLRALSLEPDYTPAHIALAYLLMFRLGQGWAVDEADLCARAARHASRAIAINPQSAPAYLVASHVRTFVDQSPREALELATRALSLNPNLPMAWGLSAATSIYLGDLNDAERRLNRYRQLAPPGPSDFLFEVESMMLELGRRNYAAAVQRGRTATELGPNFATALKFYLVALGHSGHRAEAVRVRARLMKIDPAFTVSEALRRICYEQQGERDHYAEGLRLAGVPEGMPIFHCPPESPLQHAAFH